MLRSLLIAIQFMTIFRFRNDLNETSEDMAASVGAYPLVGLILGCLLTICCLVFVRLFPPTIVGFLAVLVLAIFTQGLHLDGAADTADGLLSHRDRKRKLEIMKDSTVGAFGAVALIFIILIKGVALSELVQVEMWGAVVLFPVWSRWATSITACLSNYARLEGGLGRPFIELTGTRQLVVSAGTALLLSILIMGTAGLISALVVALAAVLGVHVWNRQIGGVTGDILGAVIELSECLGLLAAAAWIKCF